VQLDTVFRAETPEGISLALRPAGFVARSEAFMIDFALRMGIMFAVMIAATLARALGPALLMISFFAVEWFYPVAFELAMGGATPGKRALGLQVVMETGLPVTPTASVLRNLLRTADFLPALYAIGVVCLLWRNDFRRLGDLAAGTIVVHAAPVKLHGAVPDAEPLAPARALDQREQAAIVAWAGRASRLTPARFEELAALVQHVAPQDESTAKPAPAAARLLGVAHAILGRTRTSP
jgi:uncharacterized RDD family membrane protein YckC